MEKLNLEQKRKAMIVTLVFQAQRFKVLFQNYTNRRKEWLLNVRKQIVARKF